MSASAEVVIGCAAAGSKRPPTSESKHSAPTRTAATRAGLMMRSTIRPNAGSPVMHRRYRRSRRGGKGAIDARSRSFCEDELVELWRPAAVTRAVVNVNRQRRGLPLRARCCGHFPPPTTENHGIDVTDHLPLHDLVLVDRDVPNTGNVLHIHV